MDYTHHTPESARSTTERPIVLVAGGSGGHVFPAIALAEYAHNRHHPVCLITDSRGARFIEKDRLLFQQVEILDTMHWRRIFSIYRRIKQLYRQWDPLAIMGFGGMMTLAPLFIGRQSRIRCGIHQSDAIIGRANALLSPVVNGIFLGHPLSTYGTGLSAKKQSRYAYIGTPVRERFQTVSPHKMVDGPLNLCLLGGSQGAKIWSQFMPAAIGLLSVPDQRAIAIVHQCPADDVEKLQQDYEKLSLSQWDVQPFFSDMPKILDWAHAIFSRAGASTLAELSQCKRPAFLVPYPHAVKNHQWVNAQSHLNHHIGWVVDQSNLTPENLAAQIKSWLDKPTQLLYGQHNEKNFPPSDACSRLYEFCTAS